MLTGVLPENMDHHVAEVHEDPLRRGFPFDAECAVSHLRQDTVYVIGYGPGLTF